MRIDRLDHLVLTVADVDATVEFYTAHRPTPGRADLCLMAAGPPVITCKG